MEQVSNSTPGQRITAHQDKVRKARVTVWVCGMACAGFLVWGFEAESPSLWGLAALAGLVWFAAVRQRRLIPPLCASCDNEVWPVEINRVKTGEQRSYGVETRETTSYNTYTDQTGHSHQHRTYTDASYPTLIESFQSLMECPRCGYQHYRNSSTETRIG